MKTAALMEEALTALAANRLRSTLTMLGVVIGVASVILMLAIGEGSRQRVGETISRLGSNQLIVLSGAASTGGMRGMAGGLPTLTLDDAAAMAELPGVKAAAPVHNAAVQVVWGAKNKATTLTGTLPAYFVINNLELAEGEWFTDADVRTGATVAVIGETVRRELFEALAPGQSVIGQTLRVQRQVVTVVGVLKAKGQGFGGQDQDDVLLVPVTTAQRRFAGTAFVGAVGTIVVEARNPGAKGQAEQEIAGLLRQRHRIAPGAEDDFSIRDMSALSESLNIVSQVLSILLGSIAFISLGVGGIGIMNIMLVSVTERTREIGLRMALGARQLHVQLQFLVEAVLMSAAGALIGLAVGFGAGWLASRTGAVTAVFSPQAALLSLVVALAVGVGFGWWPARRAAQLQPVEALRAQ
jgi:putative ABC transport system permease protein